MPRKSKKPVRKQRHSPTGKVVGQVGQILLPMIAGIAATKADLTQWVYAQGLTALHLLLREDAEEIAGLKGKHEKERTHNHWGSTNGELSFGGRRIQVSRPRVRSKSGEEASLPHFEAFREEDPLPERVLNQILVGVSTRNYESSLDKPAAKLKWMCPEVRGKRTAPSTPSSEYHIRRQPPRVREPRSDVGSRRCVVVESGQRR